MSLESEQLNGLLLNRMQKSYWLKSECHALQLEKAEFIIHNATVNWIRPTITMKNGLANFLP